jgi:hypothetical protein
VIVVADASALVAELLRTRGRALLAHPDLRVVVAEEQWDETQYELQRRLGAIVEQGRLTDDHAKCLHDDVLALIDERVIEIIPRHLYEHMEAVARTRPSADSKRMMGLSDQGSLAHIAVQWPRQARGEVSKGGVGDAACGVGAQAVA